jgi:S-adenosylmethionine:tRNA ribosyltransferase-isomerase
MRLSRRGGRIEHCLFSGLPGLLRPGDVLVMNDTRVLKARIVGKKKPGGARAEIFCLSPSGDPDAPDAPGVWRALVRPGRKLPPGSVVELSDGRSVEILDRAEDGLRLVRLPCGAGSEEFFERCGRTPLPPYIRNSQAEPERYQTVYSDHAKTRSVAAPTAGLHFTGGLLAQLGDMGVELTFITLDVGAGTFRPVRARDVRDHRMHSEACSIGAAQAERINLARAEGRRIVAVGTTVVRTLESFADDSGILSSGARETDIFIRDGYKFRITDALLTNFHLPRSTLLMLVSAFADYQNTMNAYAEAVREKYSFFSFGDAMLID